jgi:hypothetical protein
LSYVFDLANKLEPLSTLPTTDDTTFGQVFVVLANAQNAVEVLHAQTMYAPYLRASNQSGQNLLNAIKDETNGLDFQRKMNPFALAHIRNLFAEYKTNLQAELGILAAYFVNQQGGFDILSLLFFAQNLFPADLGNKVPEAMFDVEQAGKCLAYEVPTACGFHLFRATESVLRRYYSLVTNGAAPPKVRSINVYVKAMRRAKCGDEKVLSALQQMADLHRNPLAHPEAILTVDEAISAYGIARSVITAMLVSLPVIPLTTGAPIPPPPSITPPPSEAVSKSGE